MLRRCGEKVPVCARVLRRIVVVVSLGFMSSVRIGAQAPATPEPPTEEAAAPAPPVTTAPKSNVGRFIRTLGSDFAHLPTPWNAAILGMGGTLSIVAHNSDPGLNHRFERGKWIDALYETGSTIGDGYVQIGGAVLTYVAGVAYQSPKAKHIGADLIRAYVVAGVPTVVLKHTVKRDRPDLGPSSFPSGHAAATFASATVLQRHLGWRGGVPAYLVATWVSMSRLHDKQHFASDVIFGGALGIVAGRTVARHGRSNWVLVPTATAGGVGIAVSRVHRDAGLDAADQ
jgi:membrane-associated phospholipid phosphatase